MKGLAGSFMRAAVVYALIGFAIGLVMGATQNFKFVSVHSHLNLIGWASMAVYAVFYHLVQPASTTGLARVHFWVANAGLIILSVSIALLASGVEAAGPGAAVGSLVSLVAMAIFAGVVFKSTGAGCARG